MTAFPLVFVRHGQTDWNRAGRLQGKKDIPLNGLGRRQAARNGRALRAILAEGGWRFHASPLARAMETMRIVLAEAGIPDIGIVADDRLMEVAYGEWEGRTLPDLAAAEPQAFAAREADKWGFVPPGGESYEMLGARVGEWLEELDRPTVIAAHGGVMRVLLHHLAGQPAHDAPHLAAPQDRVLIFTAGMVVTF